MLRSAAVLLALAPAALALSTDKDQPVEIEADYAELDEHKQMTVYTGNVVVVQGSLRLSGDKLTVYYDEQQHLKDAYLEGRPARFRQRPDGKDEDLEGEALRMEYHAQEDLLHLIDRAKLTQGKQVLSGPRISYDTRLSILTARGRATEATAGQGEQRGGRVRLVIPPKPKDSAATEP